MKYISIQDSSLFAWARQVYLVQDTFVGSEPASGRLKKDTAGMRCYHAIDGKAPSIGYIPLAILRESNSHDEFYISLYQEETCYFLLYIKQDTWELCISDHSPDYIYELIDRECKSRGADEETNGQFFD